MPKYRNVKIRIESPEHSKFVQKKLFEDGCFWGGGSLRRRSVETCKHRFLYVEEDGRLMHGSFQGVFNEEYNKKEIKITMTFTKSDIKSGMIIEFANKEQGIVIGDKVFNKDWHCQVSLDSFEENLDRKGQVGCFQSNWSINKIYNTPKYAKILFEDRVGINDKPILLWESESREETERKEKIAEIERKQRELADQLAELKDS